MYKTFHQFIYTVCAPFQLVPQVSLCSKLLKMLCINILSATQSHLRIMVDTATAPSLLVLQFSFCTVWVQSRDTKKVGQWHFYSLKHLHFVCVCVCVHASVRVCVSLSVKQKTVSKACQVSVTPTPDPTSISSWQWYMIYWPSIQTICQK